MSTINRMRAFGLIKMALLSFLFFPMALYGASGVMNLSRAEAAERLKKGDVGFVVAADLSKMKELAALDPSAPFYAGLLVESLGDKARAARLFEISLGSPMAKTAQEAARKLTPLLVELQDPQQAERLLTLIRKSSHSGGSFVTLKGTALYVLGRYREAAAAFQEPPGRVQGKTARTMKNAFLFSDQAAAELEAWNRAIQFLSMVKQRRGTIPQEELRPFLFDSPVNAAYRWAYEELLRSREHTIPAAEKLAGAGRLAVSGNAYQEALVHLDTVRTAELSLFFRHPALLGDLGRSYVGVSSKREEGFNFFTGWETALRTGKSSVSGLSAVEQNAVRYNLLFYAGRIRRQQGKHEEAADLFTRALALTEDPVQKDACIWYIISSAFTTKPETVPALIKTYAGRWYDDDNFYDILDRLSCYLVTQKKWDDLGDVFSAIKNGKDGAAIARYAYLMGRAVSLGYVQAGGRFLSARDYFTAAYEEGAASFYYRALAASYLGRTIVPAAGGNRNNREAFPHGNELEFYAKFFEFGAAPHAMAYVRENAARYTPGELRILAGTFAASGRYLESIQITGISMRRDGYVMERADLELYYPQPFTELIEKYAKDNGLHPQLFFGLVRTESAFSPGIASHAGAVGLAQIMPATAKEVAAGIKRRGGPDFAAGGTIDLTDPEVNLHMGAVYLKDLTISMGSPMLALLAYNGGPARIRSLRRAAPSLPEDIFIETINITETRNYGKRVMAAAAAYGYLYYGMSMHEVVSSIFK